MFFWRLIQSVHDRLISWTSRVLYFGNYDTILTRRGSFGFRNGIRRGWHEGRAGTRYSDARYETSGAVVLGASRSLIAPRVAAKRSLIKFYCAGIKLTGRLAGTSGYGLDKWFIHVLDTTRATYTRMYRSPRSTLVRTRITRQRRRWERKATLVSDTVAAPLRPYTSWVKSESSDRK